MITLRCPGCGNVVRIERAEGVSSVACPRCRAQIELGQAGLQEYLKVLTGPSAVGRRLALPARGRVLIGSDRGAWLQLKAPRVESLHCRLERDSTTSGWRLVNLSQQSGTWLNGQPVSEAALRAGDVIKLGPFELCFEAPTETGPTDAAAASTRQAPQPVAETAEPRLAGLMASRVSLACLGLVLAGLLDGGYHLMLLQQRGTWQPAYNVIIAGIGALAMMQFGLFVASEGPVRRMMAVFGLVVLAVVDVALLVPAGALLRGMLAGGLGLMTAERPAPLAVAAGTVISSTALVCYAVVVVCCVLGGIGRI